MQATLVIPLYNEEKGIPDLVARCRECFSGTEITALLVENGSTDGSRRLLEELVLPGDPIRWIIVPVNQGYGFGIMSGLREATTEIVGWAHGDQQTDVGHAIRALDVIARASDPANVFVKGRRIARPPADAFFSLGMAAYTSFLFGHVMYEINAQPTLFHRRLFDTIKDTPNDFSLDLSFYVAAKELGMQFVRIPVEFGERKFGVSSWNVDWRSKVKFIRRTLAFSRDLKKRMRQQAGSRSADRP